MINWKVIQKEYSADGEGVLLTWAAFGRHGKQLRIPIAITTWSRMGKSRRFGGPLPDYYGAEIRGRGADNQEYEIPKL